MSRYANVKCLLWLNIFGVSIHASVISLVPPRPLECGIYRGTGMLRNHGHEWRLRTNEKSHSPHEFVILTQKNEELNPLRDTPVRLTFYVPVPGSSPFHSQVWLQSVEPIPGLPSTDQLETVRRDSCRKRGLFR